MLRLLTRLLTHLLGGTAADLSRGHERLPAPKTGLALRENLPAPLDLSDPHTDDIIDVPFSIVDPHQTAARPPAPQASPRQVGIFSRSRAAVGGRPRSIADLIGEIEVSPEYQEESGGPPVVVTIVYPPDEFERDIRQQQMRAYRWQCSGVNDTEILRKAITAWSSYMNKRYGERAIRLGDVVIIDGRHYIIDRIGPQLVSYDVAEAWVRLESWEREDGFELAKRNGYI